MGHTFPNMKLDGGRIRVAVIDDHPLLREGVAKTLDSEDGISVIAQGSCAEDARRVVREEDIDLMLLDISMPGDSISAVQSIIAEQPNLKLVILTVSENEDHVLAVMRAGCDGYILKGVSGPELVRAVRAIHQGESYVSPSLAAGLFAKSRKSQKSTAQNADPLEALTYREEQILDLVARGWSNKEVAQKLNLSEKTIKHYMTKILKKLHVRNRVEAALIALTKGEANIRE